MIRNIKSNIGYRNDEMVFNSDQSANWRMSLAIRFKKNWSHLPCSYWLLRYPEKSSGQGSGMRHSVLWEKWTEQVFRYSDIFRRKFYESNFLNLLIPRKALQSSAPCDQQQPSNEIDACLHRPSPALWPNHVYILTSPSLPLCAAVLRATRKAISWVIVHSKP